jgi:hypothetical protein
MDITENINKQIASGKSKEGILVDLLNSEFSNEDIVNEIEKIQWTIARPNFFRRSILNIRIITGLLFVLFALFKALLMRSFDKHSQFDHMIHSGLTWFGVIFILSLVVKRK